MRIGIGQINAHVGAIEQNRDRILARVNEAHSSGCDLVVFPELAVCGSPPLDSIWRPGFVAACEEAVDAIRSASDGIGILVGSVTSSPRREALNRYDLSALVDVSGGELFNTAVLIEDGRILGRTAKIHLPNYDVHAEGRYFTPGPGAEVFTFRGHTIAVNVCEDLWVDGGPTEIQANLGAKWVFNLSASPFYVGKPAILRRLAQRRAKENAVGIVLANLVGGQDDLVFDGGSLVVDAEGKLLFQAPTFVEGLYVVDFSDSRPVTPEESDDLSELRSALILGLHDYVSKNGFTSVIVGLSGGIDSALVAALAVEALGPEHVTAVYLPSRFSSEESRTDACEIANRLSIELLEIPFSEIHEDLHDALPETPTGIVDENLQPRVRGTILMALANQRNALVLCPGNKSEIAMGYSTLYGDTIGALAPIADLYKTDVFRLAASLGDCIPQRVFEKPPSAELRQDHRDDDDLPPYSELDPLLAKLIEGNLSRGQLVSAGFDTELVDRVLPRYYAAEYKRHQLPPGIKVSPKAFGPGRRMPITNAYRE